MSFRQRVASHSFARPADTTAYAAEDAVSDSTSAPTVLTFNFSFGKGGVITAARLLTDQAANVARFRLHLFKTSPTALNDNAACTAPLWADRAKYVGEISFPACNSEGAGATAAYAVNTDVRLPVAELDGGKCYGILETLDAFTPASAQNFAIYLVEECEQ